MPFESLQIIQYEFPDQYSQVQKSRSTRFRIDPSLEYVELEIPGLSESAEEIRNVKRYFRFKVEVSPQLVMYYRSIVQSLHSFIISECFQVVRSGNGCGSNTSEFSDPVELMRGKVISKDGSSDGIIVVELFLYNCSRDRIEAARETRNKILVR